MEQWRRNVSRRGALKLLGAASCGLAIGDWLGMNPVLGQEVTASKAIEPFTGPGANPHWNSVGPYVSEPLKAPLILLTDRPVQLETPRQYFRTAITPNEAFFVRWHLDLHPAVVDLRTWRLRIEGNVANPSTWSLADLMQKFKPVSVVAVNQC